MPRRPTETEKAYSRRKTCGCRAKGRGEKPGPKTPWLSKFGGGYLSDAQWLAECMTARLAAKEKRELRIRFWEAASPDKEFFLAQVQQANRLLKEFPVGALLQALNSGEGKAAFSLAAKWLHPLFRRAAIQPTGPVESADEWRPPEPEPIEWSPPPILSRPSLLTRLRLDSGKDQGPGP